MTRKKKKQGKSPGPNSNNNMDATKTVEREVRVASNTKSLSEIQSEEMERRKLAMNFSRQPAAVPQQSEDDMFWEMPSEPQPSSGYQSQGSHLNVALGSAWGNRAQQSAQPPNTTSQGSFPSLSAQAKAPAGGKGHKASSRSNQQEAAAASNSLSSAASAKMSAEFKKWCKEQMVYLNGSDDMTLIDFLMSLETEREIREYVEFYLGKSAKTSKFTTEFLFWMEEESNPDLTEKSGWAGKHSSSQSQPESQVAAGGWAATANSASGNSKKKGKKKGKKLDLSLMGFNTGIHLYSDNLEIE